MSTGFNLCFLFRLICYLFSKLLCDDSFELRAGHATLNFYFELVNF